MCRRWILQCLLLAGLVNYSFSFLDSLYAQLDANCEGTNSYVCRNSKCIPKSKRCDGRADCLDSSDEEDCDIFFCKEPNYYRCKNGKCIFSTFRCDEENDCGDFSDESECDNFKIALAHATNCSNSEWQCADHLCIPKDFVCNGENDCLDGSDETMGCTSNIKCDGFKCKNGHCVPNEWVCDGHDDCHDGSDELDCQNHISPKDCQLDKKLFLCANNATCINMTSVCDKTPHCPDKSDEGALCEGTSTCATHHCSHDCVQLPTGPKCLCPSGYQTIDDKTCKDINECEIYGVCDQKCRNTPSSFECYCDEKYELQADKTTCKVVGGEAMMIFSSKTQIRGYFLQSEVLFPIAKDLKQVVGVSFDGHHVYWTDIYSEHESLVRSLEDGSGRELLLTSGLGAPEDLAVDWITGNIYFTDSEMQHIAVCNNDGTKCTVLINNDIQKPRGIVLHPSEGDMYWSDWGKKPEIAKSKMDGTQDMAFVANNIRWPNGLTIDYPNERLYWTDAKLMTLESIRLDGTDRRIILDGVVKHPYAIAIFENRLYWSDWATHSIQSCDKFTGKDHHTLVKEKREYIYGLHVFHSALKPRSFNPCSLSFCSDICLIAGLRTYTCACPQDKILSSDKHTCQDTIKKQLLVIGAKDLLLKVEHQMLGKHDITALPVVAKNIGALTYSSVNNTLYIADSGSRSIVGVKLDTGYPTQLLNENIGTITSIDYDYLGNNLYWCDVDRKTVEVLSLTTMSRRILIHDMGGETPASLALIPEEGVMFLAVKSEQGIHIDRMRMDGTIRTHVVESGLLGPVTLHYDSGLHRVFWADAGTGNIESTSAEGDDRHGFRALHATPITLTSLTKDLFWANQNSRRVYWADKDNSRGLNKKITLDLPEATEQIHLVSVMSYRVPSHACNHNNGNCSHICLLSEKAIQCACPLGMALKSDNQTCIKRQECTTNEFYCHKSDICIPKVLQCNNRKDCLMGEDEEECVYGSHCPTNHFQCKNGECIRNNLVCDLHYDCTDKSDELDCSEKKRVCPVKHFQCSDDRCINDRFICDGVKDCSDGGDETNCLSTTCSANQFRCLTGECIPKNWECDREYDCRDLSDEHTGCAQKTCGPTQFSCNNGLCIDSKLRCNRLDDCGDSSDEAACHSLDESSCRSDEFQCTSDTSICIPNTARCNGTSECPHHEDEQGCSDCHIDEFECTNKKCIPSVWICDSTDDCGDGSDESICSNEKTAVVNVNVPCENGFRCKSGACIDYKLVCNGEENCYDGDDENGACTTSCKATSNPCDQKCKSTPTGPMCLCNEGYELAGNGHSCRDIAECSKEPPVCSQLCAEQVGGYSCSCHDGYIIRSDKVSCKSIGEPMSMVFSMNNEIHQLSQADNTLRILHSEDTPKITGLDVSSSDGYVYFSIEEAGTIHRINLLNLTREYITDSGKPQKLAVDWITHNAYYVDAETADKAIRVCNFLEQRCSKVISIDTHSQVSSLAVDASNKYIFYTLTSWWVFNSPHTVIYKANLDGSKVHELVKSSAGYITGITFDPNQKLLYYADHHYGTIGRINYDGSNKAVLISNQTKPSGLSFFEDHLYFLTGFGYMGKCRLYGETRKCDTFRLNAYNTELFAIIQTSRQPMGRNVCDGHVCSHLCVPSDVGARCLCESGKVVTEGTICESKERSSENIDDRRPKFVAHSTSDSEGSGSLAVAILVPVLIVAMAFVAYYFLKRRSSGKFNVSMRFHNPSYGLTRNETTQQHALLLPGEHEYCNPIDVGQQDFQRATNAILEKVSPLVRIE